MLRNISGLIKSEVRDTFSMLHNEELHGFYKHQLALSGW
jgi:hypothetical protein